MPVPGPGMPSRRGSLRLAGVSAGAALAIACGSTGATPTLTVTAAPGRPAGTITVAASSDVATVARRVQDAVRAGGATATVVDHTADAAAVGTPIPPSTVVIGEPPAATLPLVRLDQSAGANLPQSYLVRQTADGSVVVTTNGPTFVAAVSAITAADARTGLSGATSDVLTSALPGATIPLTTPLVGVTPVNRLVTVLGRASVPVVVGRLRRAADRASSRTVAEVDLAAGSTDPAVAGPRVATATPGTSPARGASPAADTPVAVRPTTVVLVSTPESEAPLLAAAPSIGLDLPLRFVVWLDDQQRTRVGHPDVRAIAARHGIATDDPAVVRLAADVDRLARAAAGVGE